MPASWGDGNLLLSGLQLGDRVGCCHGGEIILFAQPTINVSGNRRSRRPFYAPSISTKKNGERNFRMSFIRVRHKPTDTRRRNVIVARSGFTKRRFIPATVETRFASAIQNGREHAFTNFRQDLRNIQFPLYARGKGKLLVCASRIL